MTKTAETVKEQDDVTRFATERRYGVVRACYGRPQSHQGVARNRELGKRYRVKYAEVFHYIGPRASSEERDIDTYIREDAVSLGK